MVAIDTALSVSNNDSPTTSQPVDNTYPTDEVHTSKLHCLLKRRLQLSATENLIKIAVEVLIGKYRTNKQSVDRTAAGHGTSDAVTKNVCYSATCVTRDASDPVSPCYSPLCRHSQEQAYFCKVHLPEKLQQHMCRLSYTVPNSSDEYAANESSVSRHTATESGLELDGKSDSTVNNVSNSCDHIRQDPDEDQLVDGAVSEDKTSVRDTTEELRLLTGLLHRHTCNGQICLTEVLVSRLQSLLDAPSDTRNPVYLRTVHNPGRRRGKIPVAPDFRTQSHRQSVFVLMPSTLRHLARSGGMLFTIPGFSSTVSTKADSGWIYIGPRPLFCTAWQYRTASARNLSAVALQLRVLWCCIRWHDLATDSSSTEDVAVAAETDMVTKTTILRRRDVGQDGLRSEYFVRRVSAPVAADDDWHGNCSVTVILAWFAFCFFCFVQYYYF